MKVILLTLLLLLQINILAREQYFKVSNTKNNEIKIREFFIRINLDIFIHTPSGWIRILNNKDKFKQYNFNLLTKEEISIIKYEFYKKLYK